MKILIISTIILSIVYIFFRLFFRNETNFKQLRAYLLLSILVSLLLPFNTIKINTSFMQKQVINITEDVNYNDKIISDNQVNDPILKNKVISVDKTFNWFLFIKIIYILVVCILLLRVLIQIIVLIYKFLRSDRKRMPNCILVYDHGFKNSFSFFNWIFINEIEKSESDIEKIITHEMIHVKQYHSIDIIVIEFLSAIMWFNPFVWMMRKSIHLVHEYLADEGVLNQGIDKVNYLELLLNQVAEERLISISSSFNQSLIKKRIIMMNNNVCRKNGVKIYAIIPLTLLLFAGISCVNGQNADEKVNERGPDLSQFEILTSLDTTNMNKLYVGVDNPFKIDLPGYEESELDISITNGSIIKRIDDYVIRPRRSGSVILVVRSGSEVLKEIVFWAVDKTDPNVIANEQDAEDEVVTAIAPTKMNVLYAGIENPVNIAVSGYESSEIEVSLTNGSIQGGNGSYIIIPRRPGNMLVSVWANGEVVKVASFRVKGIPNPFAMLNRKTGGQITKEDLLKQEEIKIMLANFDFDVKFEAVGFEVSLTKDGYVTNVRSESDNISESQRELITKAAVGDRVIFENILAKGPDGNIRKISPMVFEVVE